MLENRMVIDEEWGEIEYGVRHENLYERKRREWEEEEYYERREDTYPCKTDCF